MQILDSNQPFFNYMYRNRVDDEFLLFSYMSRVQTHFKTIVILQLKKDNGLDVFLFELGLDQSSRGKNGRW